MRFSKRRNEIRFIHKQSPRRLPKYPIRWDPNSLNRKPVRSCLKPSARLDEKGRPEEVVRTDRLEKARSESRTESRSPVGKMDQPTTTSEAKKPIPKGTLGSDAMSFRSLIPTRAPVVSAAPVMTELNGVVGPIARTLFRVKGIPTTFLIDCGGQCDYISKEFVARHGLERSIQAAPTSVTGYDGSASTSPGWISMKVEFECPDHPKKTYSDKKNERPFIVAPLGLDEVILGMPWLSDKETRVDPDFKAQKVWAYEEKGKRYELPLVEQKPVKLGLTSQLISQIVAGYEASEDEDGFDELGVEPLSRWKMLELCKMEGESDNRGVPKLGEPPGFEARRKKLFEEFKDVFPPELTAGLPPSRGHELEIKLKENAKIPAKAQPRLHWRHEKFQKKWIKEMLEKNLIRRSQSSFAAPHFYTEKPRR